TRGQTEGIGLKTSDDVTKEKENRLMVRKYRSEAEDVKWAQNSLVATIVNVEAVPVVQSRITDAGFNNVVLIPMGADK
ncbi:sulfate transporter, partial [Trifolium medium]|nr:sulfate transporter [Trifolium medium]